jgi:hypothetical protein
MAQDEVVNASTLMGKEHSQDLHEIEENVDFVVKKDIQEKLALRMAAGSIFS